ncbi:hypothetical protein AGMMS4957_02410 [Bacteroidia bacterium]|nr:hypothetical protein AGMMS4957_02410 [Bacteroidia bacterium]
MNKEKESTVQFYCTDASIVAGLGQLNSNGKWELFGISEVLGMGNAEYKKRLLPDAVDAIIPYNSFSGVSYIGICKDKKWGLMKIALDETSQLIKFDYNLVEDVKYASILELEKKYAIKCEK